MLRASANTKRRRKSAEMMDVLLLIQMLQVGPEATLHVCGWEL